MEPRPFIIKERIMGMYDSVMVKMICPYCGKSSNIEFQTKDLDCALDVFHVGDKVTDKLTYLDVIGDCHTPECQARSDKYSCSVQKSASGFGALFDAKIKVKDGTITDEVYDIITSEQYTDVYIESVKDKWEPYYKPRGDDDLLWGIYGKD
jgi:hypothetical protein